MTIQMNSSRRGFAAMILCLASFANAQTVEKKTLTLQGAERVIRRSEV